jgi:hypothetical protein
MSVDAMQIVKEAVEAHGGMEHWNSLVAIDAKISARGFLFTAKRRPVLDHVRMRAYTKEPRFVFFDFPKTGQRAELIGDSEVRILDRDGTIISRREEPRMVFRGFRRQFSWDDLDFVYFGGYATWNYLTAPFLLNRQGFQLEALEPVQTPSGELARVQAIFPPDIPTHSRKQVFYFDDRRLLRRLDYTAEVVGGWAHAAHFCEDHRTFGRFVVPTHRRALPMLFGKPLSGPVLVAIDVHDIQSVGQ